MKLIKKILAIMFAFMMVVGMGTKVNAEENESTTEPTGKITINNAVNGQTYSIYKILELESFSGDNYSYKPVDAWKEFFQVEDAATGKQKGAGSEYVTIDENGYATWKSGTDVKTFAKLALEYAKTKRINNNGRSNAEGNTVTFNNLPLGYYLVDSSVGALCGLDTTNSEVTIQEKNDVPTVEKKVSNTANGNYSDSNFANIGDTVYFQTLITAQPGAQNYVLHDTMSDGLTLNKDISIKYENDSNEIDSGNYTINYDVKHTDSENNQTTCTFDITFTETFCNTLTANKKIVVTYSATLNDKALIHQGNVNETQLSYGDNNKTNKSTTSTVTYEIKVLKYSGALNNTLKGATFKLYDSEVNEGKTVCKSDPIQLVKNGNDGQNYRRALETENNGFAEVTTTENGAFSIQGLKPGTYYLEETAAPKGYNKLSNKIEVVINDDGTLKIDDQDEIGGESITQVKVENKTGTLLPSTGGMGTTIIYMAGAILVIASGIVLVSKKRSKAK